MKKLFTKILPCVLVLFLSTQALAEEQAKEQNIPNTPQKLVEQSSPVMVEFSGADSLGSALSTRMKERFNASNLFKLENADTPKIRILISSISEFPNRPQVGSAYSITWLFSMSDETLRHYLDTEVGILTPENIHEVCAKLLEKTDNIATRYAYLFPEQD